MRSEEGPRVVAEWLQAEHGKGPRRVWSLSVDPGRTTGVALLSVPWESIYGNAKGKILSHHGWEVTGPLHVQVQKIGAAFMRVNSPDHRALFVVEDFDLGRNGISGAASQADVITPVRLGAALEYVSVSWRAEITWQLPSLAMSTATDERLKAWGLYDTHSGLHIRDATRHGITAIRRLAEGAISLPEDL